jgi:transposase InsO family protein
MKAKPKTPGRKEGSTGHRKWPNEVRLQLAQAVVDRGAAAATVAQAFGIPVTTVVDWSHRYRRYGADPSTWWAVEMRRRKERKAQDRATDPRRAAVVASRQKHPEHGTRRIRDLMARFQGLGVSETTVRRILHEEGLLESVPAPVAKPGPSEHRFERAEPNQLWQSDIFTFLLRRHQRLYVAAFMDDYSRYIVSLVVAHHQRSSLVLEALARGIAEYGAPREVLTDQGRQYVAWRGTTDFEGELRRQGIHHIKSRPHHPQTLGKIERFWKTLWDEFLSRTVFADFEDCQRRIALFVQAYNFRRPHQGIAGVVPADRFFRAAPQVRAVIEKGVAENALALSQEQPRRKPFYLVGRFGDKDLTIALSGRGLMVKLGEMEETIPLRGEEEDDETKAPARVAQEPSAADTEVAPEVAGDRPDRAVALPDGPERAFGGDAGDGRDLGSGDLAGELLPDGDPSAQRYPAGPGAAVSVGGSAELLGAADRGLGGEGQGAGAGAAADAAPAAHDAPGDPDPGEENELDPAWQRSFAGLEAEEAPAQPVFDPGDDWRGRALTWERKLTGADEASYGQEELRTAAGGASGSGDPVRDHDGGALGRADGERGSAPAEPLPEPLPDADAPDLGVHDREPGQQAGWAAPDSRAGEAATQANGEATHRERTAAQAGGDNGPDLGGGQWPPEGSDRSEDQTWSGWGPIAKDPHGGRVSGLRYSRPS